MRTRVFSPFLACFAACALTVHTAQAQLDPAQAKALAPDLQSLLQAPHNRWPLYRVEMAMQAAAAIGHVPNPKPTSAELRQPCDSMRAVRTGPTPEALTIAEAQPDVGQEIITGHRLDAKARASYMAGVILTWAKLDASVRKRLTPGAGGQPYAICGPWSLSLTLWQRSEGLPESGVLDAVTARAFLARWDPYLREAYRLIDLEERRLSALEASAERAKALQEQVNRERQAAYEAALQRKLAEAKKVDDLARDLLVQRADAVEKIVRKRAPNVQLVCEQEAEHEKSMLRGRELAQVAMGDRPEYTQTHDADAFNAALSNCLTRHRFEVAREMAQEHIQREVGKPDR